MSGNLVLNNKSSVKSPLFPSVSACRLSSLIAVTPAEAGEHSFNAHLCVGISR
jgi:hypothetical protein